MTGTFRFGVNMTSVGTRSDWVAKCQRAEDLGYDVILVPDHLSMGAPFPSLMLAASVTTLPQLGTFVLNAGFFNPVLLARDVFAVNTYTDGRFELGLGAGYVREEFEEAGLGWPSAGERVSHLERTVAAIVEKHWDMPLLIGGNGDRVLRLAAKHADTVAFTGLKVVPGNPPLEFLQADEVLERVEFVRAQAGGRTYESNILIQSVVPADDRAAKAGELRQLYKMDFTVEQILELPALLIGQPTEIADQLRAQRDRFGFTYFTVLEPSMEDFAPVLKLLAE
ncbi:putative F420-dependent oxidoreductase [Kibdelosporangium banguiense]|uniref:F420-dependent oxidoreductase n=1 Tax=Kibdelosporangium banguiense TaxID=1365924 RepID=A0ABS4TM31_9PSEU|nr:TIGR03621 family F420-dependent LLM class oxidoreductase [Kibdelosporangium banguiense]MBP2325455.1 putative F420-dependent oxidoreductase [Kibdelosporangium banguiense]